MSIETGSSSASSSDSSSSSSSSEEHVCDQVAEALTQYLAGTSELGLMQGEALNGQLEKIDALTVTREPCPTCFSLINTMAIENPEHFMMQFALARACRFKLAGVKKKDKARSYEIMKALLGDARLEGLTDLKSVLLFYCADVVPEDPDHAKACNLLQEVIALDALPEYNAAAMNGLASIYVDRGDEFEAQGIDMMHRAMAMGCAEAAYNLGGYYDNKEEYEQAMHYYQRCVELGGFPALGCIGELYEFGHGVKKDLNKAMEYYLMAADAGSAEHLAKCSMLGLELAGSEDSEAMETAKELLEIALEAGDDEALVYLASLAADEGDFERAEHLFKQSIDNGNVDSHALMGEFYMSREMPEEAMECFQKATSLGSDVGRFNLACVKLGRCQPFEAAMLFRHSGMRGHEESNEAYGVLMSHYRNAVQPPRFVADWDSCFGWYVPRTRASVRQWLSICHFHPIWGCLPLEIVYEVIQYICCFQLDADADSWRVLAENFQDLLYELSSTTEGEFSGSEVDSSEEEEEEGNVL